jgi:ATP-dependent protease HslVU (ClpYQ) peptidase subunit
MTTLVVVKKAGYVAIAGDSLTTFGGVKLLPEYDKSHDKILHANGTYFGIAGSAAHHLVMESILSKNTEMKLGSKMEIFETFRKIHPVLKEEHFLNPKEEEDDPYESSQLTSLIANKAGIFGVYSMREVFEFDRFWSIGSGREFALGAMFSQYDKLKTAEEIARAGILAGCEFDTSSYMPMSLYKVKLAK